MKNLVLLLIASVASASTIASTPDLVDIQLDPIYSESNPTITKAKPTVPKEMEPIIESAMRTGDILRTPATATNGKKERTLASTVNDGFEFKVRQGKHVTAFWVKKSGEQFDLVFATNGGSRASSTIPVEHYAQLTAVAGALRSPASTDLKKCKDSYVRLVVITDGKEESPVTTCLSAKGKQAEQIKRFGSALVSYVR
ncbi:MAG: hypothetical protein V4760_03125 [Bdellovibrionota bacterium]